LTGFATLEPKMVAGVEGGGEFGIVVDLMRVVGPIVLYIIELLWNHLYMYSYACWIILREIILTD